MVTLAVTGGIGSGKSFVAGILSVMGFPVFDTDTETKMLYRTSSQLRTELRFLLGDDVFTPDGNIDRVLMASKVFSDKSLLAGVEEVVYPFLVRHLNDWLEKCCQCGTKVAVVESALILEKDIFRPMIDLIVTVSAPEEIRISRAVNRDGTDRSKVEERMKHQNSDAWREERADYIVINDGRPLLPQLDIIMNDIKKGQRPFRG